MILSEILNEMNERWRRSNESGERHGQVFQTTVTGIDEGEVKRRVAELMEKGFEVVTELMETRTVDLYKRTNSVGRSKVAFL